MFWSISRACSCGAKTPLRLFSHFHFLQHTSYKFEMFARNNLYKPDWALSAETFKADVCLESITRRCGIKWGLVHLPHVLPFSLTKHKLNKDHCHLYTTIEGSRTNRIATLRRQPIRRRELNPMPSLNQFVFISLHSQIKYPHQYRELIYIIEPPDQQPRRLSFPINSVSHVEQVDSHFIWSQYSLNTRWTEKENAQKKYHKGFGGRVSFGRCWSAECRISFTVLTGWY